MIDTRVCFTKPGKLKKPRGLHASGAVSKRLNLTQGRTVIEGFTCDKGDCISLETFACDRAAIRSASSAHGLWILTPAIDIAHADADVLCDQTHISFIRRAVRIHLLLQDILVVITLSVLGSPDW